MQSVGIASGALAAGSAIGFVLERDRQPDPVAGNLAVFDGDVLAGHFGDARVADCRRGGLDRAASSMLPRLGARANDLGHAVDTHVLSLLLGAPADPGTVLRTKWNRRRSECPVIERFSGQLVSSRVVVRQS